MFKIGIDIVEVKRIKEAMERSNSFKEKIFSDKEIEYCESRKNKYESYAARFCAKESYVKAINESINFKDLEILKGDNGRPYMLYKGEKVRGDVSLSHTEELAIANVLILVD